ncbi:hypothetical protein [Mycobacterium sp. OTB74]|uniref:hypothetical protein n=1 Tax=Mycobacterium sp. OTB74 TaxID=1853452 RepID=UPI002475E1F3|nr:hypothetical protein [Mycobacterium sp. OTB74]MDH6246521.1 hypothetical protein [Mycobacterium sp. OTB74]
MIAPHEAGLPLLDPLLTATRSAPTRYRLHVIASSVFQATQTAGGAICDRALAGWQVTVDVPPSSDIRAITILGARLRDTAEVALDEYAPPVVVVKCGDVADTPAMIDLAAVDKTLAGCWEALAEAGNIAAHPRRVSHQVSRAAGIFKDQALSAAGSGHRLTAHTEYFRWVSFRQ